jgi:hypothetical protein
MNTADELFERSATVTVQYLLLLLSGAEIAPSALAILSWLSARVALVSENETHKLYGNLHVSSTDRRRSARSCIHLEVKIATYV